MDLTTLVENGMDVAEASGLLMNIMWTMIGGILVYFMQAGFAMCDKHPPNFPFCACHIVFNTI